MIKINGVDFEILGKNMTIYQFLYTHGITVPCFCYHEKLSIAGNCRMCLVEVNNAMVVSCAMPLLDGMIIITNSQRLLHARESVVEFLLVNHPLDCPVCDQGGECDLQDITRSFGSDRGRSYTSKRSVDNLNCFGSLIKTIMTRCIHCTRCVRFLNEYGDTYDLGVIGRGSTMEIGTFVKSVMYNELSGNIIDLCPVGALTSMPYAFSARPWELRNVETIDVLDSLLSAIRFDISNNKIVRTLPILSEVTNEDWISNKARFSFDALNHNKQVLPQIKLDNVWITISWAKASIYIWTTLVNMPFDNFLVLGGPYLDLETGWSLKNFFNSIGCNSIYYNTKTRLICDSRSDFLLISGINMLEYADFILLINTNLRLENPVLNSRIRKNYLNRVGSKKPLTIYSIGLSLNYLTVPVLNIGNSSKTINNVTFWKNNYMKIFCFNSFKSNFSYLNEFKSNIIKPIVLFGSSNMFRQDSITLFNTINLFSKFLENKLSTKKSIFNFVADFTGKLTASELAFKQKFDLNLYNKSNLIYYIGENNFIANSSAGFSIFQGSVLNINLKNFVNLILPTSCFAEKRATYLNLEGLVRVSEIVITPHKDILSDIEVYRLLNLFKNKFISTNFSIIDKFDFTMQIINWQISYKCCFFGSLEKFLITFKNYSGFALRYKQKIVSLPNYHKSNSKYLNNAIFCSELNNYYASDGFLRLSKIMSLCASKVVISHFSKHV